MGRRNVSYYLTYGWLMLNGWAEPYAFVDNAKQPLTRSHVVFPLNEQVRAQLHCHTVAQMLRVVLAALLVKVGGTFQNPSSMRSTMLV